MRVCWCSVLLLLSWLGLPILADKDTDFYPEYSNPNVQYDMYWKDAINVLQDIDQFSSLHVKYHSCVWSEYGNGAVEHENGCSGSGDGEHWYLGRTQCFRANVAYTLYGVLKDGDSSSSNESHSSNCNRHSYINSFFTNYGVESFVDPLGIDSSQANSQCTSQEGGQEQYHGNSNMEKMFDGYTSYTTGCSASGGFVIEKFNGAFCDSYQRAETLYKLADFNDAISGDKCVQVYAEQVEEEEEVQEEEQYEEVAEEEEEEAYQAEEEVQYEAGEQDDNENDANYAYNYYYGNKNDGDRKLEDSVAYQILSKSTSCSIREYPNHCPDPFGLKMKYTVALEKAAEKGTATPADRAVKMLPWFSFAFLVISVTMFTMSYFSHLKAVEKLEKETLSNQLYPKKESRNSNRNLPEPLSGDQQDPPSMVKKVSRLGEAVALKVSGSLAAAKESFRRYAEEEEVFVDEVPDVEESRYNAPIRASDSGEEVAIDDLPQGDTGKDWYSNGAGGIPTQVDVVPSANPSEGAGDKYDPDSRDFVNTYSAISLGPAGMTAPPPIAPMPQPMVMPPMVAPQPMMVPHSMMMAPPMATNPVATNVARPSGTAVTEPTAPPPLGANSQPPQQVHQVPPSNASEQKNSVPQEVATNTSVKSKSTKGGSNTQSASKTTTSTVTTRKQKRPRLANVSKAFFGKKK